MKNKNNTRKKIIIGISIVILIAIIFFAVLYYITSTVNNYSYSEKNWISEHSSESIEVYIQRGLPVYSLNGEGVYYDYLNALNEDTGLTFDITTTEDDTIKYRLINKKTIENDDLLFYKDHYVILSNNEVTTLEELNSKDVGILSEDEETIKYYLTNYSKINYKVYDTFEQLKNAKNSDQIKYVILPMYKYLDQILVNEYKIAFHLDGLYSYYCLELDETNVNLTNVMNKFYYRWQERSIEKKNEHFLDLYYSSNGYTQLEKDSIISEDLIVGYIENLPFEGKIKNEFAGLTETYLSRFSGITGVTYNYVEYENLDEMSVALNGKKIDLMLNYYSLGNDNYETSRNLGSSEYVVLAHIDNNLVVNSLYSLVNTEVTMLANMNLKYNMASKNLFEIKDYNSIEALLKYIDETSVVIIEKEVYDYYKDSKLKNYSIRYMDSVKLNNAFLLNTQNSAFNKLFDFYLSMQSTSEIKNETVETTITVLKNNRFISFIIDNFIYILIALLIISLIVYYILKHILKNKKEKNDGRLLYLDVMTNLKNRNYLNNNMEFWESNKVYPQTIIVIDINKLKTLNDKYGHEAGDKQIKAVASVLIKTQRDNSEIMRTDGDEFMIYLIGYEEKRISSYIHKLNKEIMTVLPNKEFGISIGYSMITSELDTIDDAINDALTMIKRLKK